MVLWKTGKYRSQSAMEYLMTYGWAILIIAVVLGVLFQLGVFNGSNFSSGVCLPISGYLCSNPLLSSSGTLSMTFGYQGQNFTVDGYSCSSSAQAPSSSSFTSSGTSKLQPGQEESITVNCPVSSGAVIGTPFSGYLWIEYNQGGKDDLITQFASIQIKVDTNQVFGAGCSGTVLEYVPISIDNTNTVDATPSTQHSTSQAVA
ncbi:MAG: hypothetical protein M1504_03095 [Candidatus Marsarchaeota archaeon]|nr:hypothetical protein [Candidatus Marsarchaeota archaeon]